MGSHLREHSPYPSSSTLFVIQNVEFGNALIHCVAAFADHAQICHQCDIIVLIKKFFR